jgi:hypothetical protein
MPTTYIKGLVNMHSRPVSLTNNEDPGALSVTAQPNSAASCYMPVPWCTSVFDFNNGKRLTLEFDFVHRDMTTHHLVTNIYQQTIGVDDSVRFVYRGSPIDGVGFTSDWLPADGFNQDGARALAADRSGAPFRVFGDAEAVLVVDERMWVVLYRIGHQARR